VQSGAYEAARVRSPLLWARVRCWPAFTGHVSPATSFLSSVEEIAVSATNVATSPRTAASYGVHSEVGVLRKVLVYRGLGGRQRHEALLATDPVLAAPDAQVGLLKQLALQEATTVGLIHCSVAAGRQTASSR
jgi:hypothetical protein